MRGFEDDQLRMEIDLPGFGGLARDTSGVVVVYAPANRTASEVRSVVASIAPGLRVDATLRLELAAGAFEIRTADYSFSQLVDWKDRLSVRVLPRDGVLGVDADESRNRVTVTTQNEGPRAGILETANSIGMPEGAIEFKLGRMPRLLATVRDKFRPTGGGIQIVNNRPSDPEYFTLSFNVKDGLIDVTPET